MVSQQLHRKISNWLNGLFGDNENNKFARDLARELLENNKTSFTSKYTVDGTIYTCTLKITSKSVKDAVKDATITVKVDAEEVLQKIQEEKQKIRKPDNLYDTLE